eukprot:3377723-Pleurochrysis_carterae.AAC.2
MLDIDYLGEVNNPDGLPNLYDQPSAVRRGKWSGTARYCSIFAVHDVDCFSRFFLTPPSGRRQNGLFAKDPDGSDGHQRVAGCLIIDSFLITPTLA